MCFMEIGDPKSYFPVKVKSKIISSRKILKILDMGRKVDFTEHRYYTVT